MGEGAGLPGLLGEQAAFERVCRSLLRSLGPGDTRIEYDATLLSAVTFERVRAFNRAGRLEVGGEKYRPLWGEDGLSDAAADLRAAMYRPGAGTWFSARFIVLPDRRAKAEYNYDEEPEWDAPVDSVAYVRDQERFPRDEGRQPRWLRGRLAEGRAKIEARDG